MPIQDSSTTIENKKQSKEVSSENAKRIIIRNLQYDVKEKHLKKSFGKFGNIVDVNIPVNSENNMNKGYWFLEFSTREEAQKLIDSMNSKEYKGRQITVEFAKNIPFDGKSKDSSHKIKMRSKLKLKSSDKNKDASDDKENVNGNVEKKRLSVKEKIKLRKSKKKFQKEVEKGISLFVKNIDDSTTQEQLKEFFKKHGEVSFVGFKKDSDNKNKGFAFIKFKNREVVDKLANLSSEYWKSADNEPTEHLNQIKSQLQFNGKTLSLFKTIAKESSSKVNKSKHPKDQAKSSQSPLTSFGLSLPPSSLLYPLTPSSILTREKLLSLKQEEMKSNPNLRVSKCHLRLFNLDSRMTTPKLKQLINGFIDDWREETDNTIEEIISELEWDGAQATLRVKNKKLARYLILALNGFVVGNNPDGLIVDYALDIKTQKKERKHNKEEDKDRRDKRLKKRQLKRDHNKQQEQKITIDKILDIEQLKKMAKDTNSREKKKRILKRIQAIQDGFVLPQNSTQSSTDDKPTKKKIKDKTRKRKHRETKEPVSEVAMSFEDRINKRAKTSE